VTDPFYLALVALPWQAANQPVSADVLGAVAQQLTGVLTATAETLTDPVCGVHDSMIAPAFQARHVYHEAASALRTIPYAVAWPRPRPDRGLEPTPGTPLGDV
jgi:hypothetical protein